MAFEVRNLLTWLKGESNLLKSKSLSANNLTILLFVSNVSKNW
jgi:hypothetical protein